MVRAPMHEGLSQVVTDERSDDAITRDFRVFQRVRGHRYSLDDVLTAYVAAKAKPGGLRVLDLGSGIGSVALMVAWKLPEAEITTVEAQEISFALQRENFARNGLTSRSMQLFGDFRDESMREAARARGLFALITGTPPYFDPKSALASSDSQRTYARLEMRGGVEAYIETAAPLLTEGGALVVCADALKPERVLAAAAQCGLHPSEALVVHPRAGKAPLFTVWTLRKRMSEVPFVPTPWIARDEHGVRTPAQYEIRAFFGLPMNERTSDPEASLEDGIEKKEKAT
jgi:tRNA1Val (adenine37-N6)-methyltransferase